MPFSTSTRAAPFLSEPRAVPQTAVNGTCVTESCKRVVESCPHGGEVKQTVVDGVQVLNSLLNSLRNTSSEWQ